MLTKRSDKAGFKGSLHVQAGEQGRQMVQGRPQKSAKARFVEQKGNISDATLILFERPRSQKLSPGFLCSSPNIDLLIKADILHFSKLPEKAKAYCVIIMLPSLLHYFSYVVK